MIIKPYDTVYMPENMGELSTAWHNLQTLVPGGIQRDGANIPDVLCPIVQAGFKPDFAAEISDCPADLVSELGENPITGWKVLLADLRTRNLGVIPLHVAKEGYCAHQNKALFESGVKAAEKVVGNKGFEVAVVGTLGAYSQFILSLALKDQASFEASKGDVWQTFYNIVSSHNALVASADMLSAVRTVCMNTVNMALADSSANGTQASIKHTKNSGELITPEHFAANLKQWLLERDTLKATLKALQAFPMSKDQFRAFAAGLFTNEKSDCLSTTSFNRVENMVPRFEGGRGDIGKGNKGQCAYDALNAITEEFSHGESLGQSRGKGAVRAEKRFANANFGRGNDWKREALRVMSTEDTLTATIKRGQVLYDDKVKAMAVSN